MSWDSSVSVVNRLWAGRGRDFFPFPLHSNWLWGSPSLISTCYEGLFLLGVKWLVYEADHLPPSNAEVKNVWRHTWWRCL